MQESGARAPSDLLTSEVSGHDTLEGLRATIDLTRLQTAAFAGDIRGIPSDVSPSPRRPAKWP